MTDVDIEPDPSRPLGGYARVVLPAGTLAPAEVSLTVYEMFKERFLGQGGWQPTETAFGPYRVETTADGQHFVIGPEIVNHLSEFVPVRLGFGGLTAEVTWPDTVAVAPNAPPIGEVIGRAPEPSEPLISTTEPEPTPEPGTDGPPVSPPPPRPISPPEPEPGTTQGPGGDGETVKGGGRLWVTPLLVGLAVVALAAGGYYYWTTLETEAEPDVVVEEEDAPKPEPELVVEPEPEPKPVLEHEPDPVAPCAAEVLTGSDAAFANRLESLRGCSDAVSAETALAVLDAGVSAENAEALLLFGHLYNPDVTDEDIESAMGLSFSDNLEVAIDYYTQARDAGSEEAADALSQACDSLRAFDPAAAEDICE